MTEDPTVQEVFSVMEEVVSSSERLQRKFNATVLFQVDGQEKLISAKATPAVDSKPDLTVRVSMETMQALLAKKMTPQQAFMKGKLKIKGKMSLAMKLTMVLEATRKALAKQRKSRL